IPTGAFGFAITIQTLLAPVAPAAPTALLAGRSFAVLVSRRIGFLTFAVITSSVVPGVRFVVLTLILGAFIHLVTTLAPTAATTATAALLVAVVVLALFVLVLVDEGFQLFFLFDLVDDGFELGEGGGTRSA